MRGFARRLLAILTACCGLVATSAPVFAQPLPFFTASPSLPLTPSKEQQMGEEFMAMLQANGLILDDPIATEYVKSIGNQLVAASDRHQRHFEFFLVADPNINAFAGPNGYIGVNAGLILATENESELAAVMAHELAHITQGHLNRTLEEASRMNKATLAGLLGAVALSAVSAGAATGAVMATMAGAEQRMLNFSRSQEKEADRMGMDTLMRSGFDPTSMSSFFQKLQKEERFYDQTPELLLSHPLTADRISDMQNRTQAAAPNAHTNSLSYYLIKTRLDLLLSRDTHSTLTKYEKLYASQHAESATADAYGYGIALLASAQAEKGYQLLQKLVTQYPDNLILQLGFAHAALETHRHQDMLHTLQQLQQNYPENYAVNLALAHGLLENDKPEQAIDILQRYMLDYPDSLKPYGTLARAQAAAGRTVEAYQTRAKFFHFNGDPRQAIDQLKIALTETDNAATQQRIKAQIAAIEEELLW